MHMKGLMNYMITLGFIEFQLHTSLYQTKRAGGRIRTDTRFDPLGILSPVRLPISPHRRGIWIDLE